MASNPSKVLRVNSVEEASRYRDAVAEILIDIQKHEGQTLLEIANAIDVSLGTISNAANKKTDLSPVFLTRLAQVYGWHVLQPFASLCGAILQPMEASDTADILPFIHRAGLKIAEARDPKSPGGIREVHTERFGYLPTLRDLHRQSSILIAQIEEELRGAA